MKLSKIRDIVSLFAVLVSVGADAQTLNLKSCIDEALRNNPDIRSITLKVERSQKSLEQQKSIQRPQISVWGEYDPLKTYVIPISGKFNTLDDDGWSVGVSARQRVYDFGTTTHKIEASRTKKRGSVLTLKEAKALLVYTVKKAYASAISLQDALTVRQKDLEVKKALYEQAKAMVAQGLKSPADESRFLSSVKAAQEAVAKAESDYKKGIYILEKLMAVSLRESVELDSSGVFKEKADIPATYTEILKENLSIKIARNEQKAAHESYKSARAERYGTIDAIAEAAHFDTLNSYDTKLIALRYTVPLYSGGAVKAKKEQARIEELIAAEETTSKKLQLTEEIKSLLSDIEALDRSIEARKAQLDSADVTAEVVGARYKEGLATYIEVLDAEAVRLEAKLALILARYAKAEKIFRLEYLNAK